MGMDYASLSWRLPSRTPALLSYFAKSRSHQVCIAEEWVCCWKLPGTLWIDRFLLRYDWEWSRGGSSRVPSHDSWRRRRSKSLYTWLNRALKTRWSCTPNSDPPWTRGYFETLNPPSIGPPLTHRYLGCLRPPLQCRDHPPYLMM